MSSPQFPHSSRKGRYLEFIPAIIVLVMLVWRLVIIPEQLNPDVAGQIRLAHSIRNGVRLYHDVFEINPPLWFWMAVPIDWLAERLGVRPDIMVVVATSAASMGALELMRRLLGPIDRARKIAFVSYSALILMAVPTMCIGQREHIALIASLPYLLLAASRRQGLVVDLWLALLVGASAALGFALKHYFLGVPVVIEIWLLLGLRHQWRPFRAETLALALVGACYVAAIFWITPEYLTETVPVLRLAYGGVGVSLLDMMTFLQLLWLCAIVVVASQYRSIVGGKAPVTVALLVGGAGFVGAWFIQHKGWPYQALPATECFMLALAALIMETKTGLNRFARIVAPAVLLLPVPFATMRNDVVPPEMDLSPALVELRSGDSYALISSEGRTRWPSTDARGLQVVGRYPQFWMLDALSQRPLPPAVAAFGRTVTRETAIDFRCAPPKIIVFVQFDRQAMPRLPNIDPEAYFLGQPEFATVMRHYRLSKRGHIFDAYRLVTPLEPIAPQLCRKPVTLLSTPAG